MGRERQELARAELAVQQELVLAEQAARQERPGQATRQAERQEQEAPQHEWRLVH